eukprot:s1347_g4.t1
MVERMAQAQSGEPSLLCEIFGYFEVRGHGRQSHESHSIIDSDRLEHALTKDLELLQELGLVDYSLLMAYEEGEIGKSGRIRLGIIDFLQPYTLDKKLESTVKKLVQRHEPTIVAPDQYARRLYEFAHAAFQAAPKDD